MPRVVVVDSHERVLEQLAARLVQESELELCGCASLTGLDEIVEECHPDVVLIDPYRSQSYNLPILQEFVQLHPELRIIVLTAVVDTSTRIAMKSLGVDEVLEKRVDFDRVVRAIVDRKG